MLLNQLQIMLTPVPDAKGYANKAAGELWCEVQINCTTCNYVIIPILKWHWDGMELIEWFIESQQYLLNEQCPFQVSELSIAQSSKLSTHIDDPADDELLDELHEVRYNYQQHHSFWYGMQGADIATVYIGLDLHNIGEVSCCNHPKNRKDIMHPKYIYPRAQQDIEWVYKFDMDQFIINHKQYFVSFLDKISSMSLTDKQYSRMRSLRQTLRSILTDDD